MNEQDGLEIQYQLALRTAPSRQVRRALERRHAKMMAILKAGRRLPNVRYAGAR